jgi:hypothetical protein
VRNGFKNLHGSKTIPKVDVESFGIMEMVMLALNGDPSTGASCCVKIAEAKT